MTARSRATRAGRPVLTARSTAPSAQHFDICHSNPIRGAGPFESAPFPDLASTSLYAPGTALYVPGTP